MVLDQSPLRVDRSPRGNRPPGMSSGLTPKVIITMGQARNGLQTQSNKHCEPEKDEVFLLGGIPEIVGYGTLV